MGLDSSLRSSWPFEFRQPRSKQRASDNCVSREGSMVSLEGGRRYRGEKPMTRLWLREHYAVFLLTCMSTGRWRSSPVVGGFCWEPTCSGPAAMTPSSFPSPQQRRLSSSSSLSSSSGPRRQPEEDQIFRLLLQKKSEHVQQSSALLQTVSCPETCYRCSRYGRPYVPKTKKTRNALDLFCSHFLSMLFIFCKLMFIRM